MCSNKQSLVSIIIPVYNGERYIGQAIKSVLAQSHYFWELLIINDGSNDNTENVIYSFSDDRIFYFSQKNKGVSAARNVGLNNLNGDFFCFLDADDLLPSDSIKNRLKMFEFNSDITFVDGHVSSFKGSVTNVVSQYVPFHKGNPFDELLSLSSSCFFGITWMIKRNRNKVYQFSESMDHAEDLWFYTQLSSDKESIYSFVNDRIYYRRLSSESAMTDIEGIFKGYWQYFERVNNMPTVAKAQKNNLRKKIKSIILKTSVSKFRFRLLISLYKEI